jgi:broad specificity phosphatase PhoE
MAIQTIINTIRHAHTSYNVEKRYAGSVDVSLNEKGEQDSRLAARKLADVKFDIVVTSTLKRSIETARILIGDKKTLIVHNKLCVERNFGVFEGKTWDEIQNMQPPVLFINVGNDLHSVNPKNGEPFEEVWARAKKFRKFLFQNYPGNNILVVSHGVFLQMFHGVLRGLSCIESLAAYPANLELATFTFSGSHLIDEKIAKLATEHFKF